MLSDIGEIVFTSLQSLNLEILIHWQQTLAMAIGRKMEKKKKKQVPCMKEAKNRLRIGK